VPPSAHHPHRKRLTRRPVAPSLPRNRHSATVHRKIENTQPPVLLLASSLPMSATMWVVRTAGKSSTLPSRATALLRPGRFPLPPQITVRQASHPFLKFLFPCGDVCLSLGRSALFAIPVRYQSTGRMKETALTSKADWTARKSLCPMVRDPVKDCYCYDMNSQKIPAAIYYCSDKFEECVIYQRVKATRYCLGR
jgi:hypothetical protein